MSRELQEVPTAGQSEILPLIQQAIEKGIDPDKLEKLMDLHERWLDARAAEKFGKALENFQSEMPQIHKGRKTAGGGFSFTYASLDDVMAKAQPILARHGISLAFDSMHTTVGSENVINVTLRIRVGSYFEDRKFGCPIPIDLKASQPQKWGAALSYAKRYALCAALNIVITDEDDDAAGVVSTISATQMVELECLIAETKADLGRFLKWIDAESLDMIKSADFVKARDQLKRKKSEVK